MSQPRCTAQTAQAAPAEPALDSTAAHLQRLRDVVADALQEPKLLAVVAAEARTGNWRASAWLLSRMYPSRWGERVREGPFMPADDDPFREVDELAERRRQRVRPDGY